MVDHAPSGAGMLMPSSNSSTIRQPRTSHQKLATTFGLIASTARTAMRLGKRSPAPWPGVTRSAGSPAHGKYGNLGKATDPERPGLCGVERRPRRREICDCGYWFKRRGYRLVPLAVFTSRRSTDTTTGLGRHIGQVVPRFLPPLLGSVRPVPLQGGGDGRAQRKEDNAERRLGHSVLVPRSTEGRVRRSTCASVRRGWWPWR